MTDPVNEDLAAMPEGVTEDRRKNGAVNVKEHVDKRMDAFQVQLYKFYAFFGVVIIVTALVFAIVISAQGRTSEDLQDQADDIQTQRFDSLFTGCVAQNKRHDTAIEEAKKRLPPEEVAGRIFIIDALQPPIKNCKQYATDRLKGDK